MEKSKNRNLSQFLNCEHLEPFPDAFRNVLVQKRKHEILKSLPWGKTTVFDGSRGVVVFIVFGYLYNWTYLLPSDLGLLEMWITWPKLQIIEPTVKLT